MLRLLSLFAECFQSLQQHIGFTGRDVLKLNSWIEIIHHPLGIEIIITPDILLDYFLSLNHVLPINIFSISINNPI
jgi:hypothetical protein